MLGIEIIFVPRLHPEYSDTATIGNPLRSSIVLAVIAGYIFLTFGG